MANSNRKSNKRKRESVLLELKKNITVLNGITVQSVMFFFLLYSIIKRSEHNTSLLDIMRSEQEIMNKYCVHDIIKRSEHNTSLLDIMRSE
ncbi:MAG: hypothetical protein H6Q59_25 [Firmicutes bacterium]|nr:hypothetical protein [Bacillota bacterium]